MNRPKIGRTAIVSPESVSPESVSPVSVSHGLVGTGLVSTILDVGCVLAFVAIGRHSHHDGDSVAGIWHTAWPFLAGLAIGLGATRAWRRPLTVVPAGLSAWLGAALAGMVLRVLADQGTALAFIGVTLDPNR